MFTLPNPSHQGRGVIINPLPLWERVRVGGKIDFCKSLNLINLLLLFNTSQSLLWGFLPPLWKRGARGDFKLIKFT
jgi:hypothetical protein